MLLVNHMLDCAEVEERVVPRADFSFLNLEGVIRVSAGVCIGRPSQLGG